MLHLSPKHKKYLKSISWVLLIFLLVLLILIKVIPYVAPFVVALFITFMIERPVGFLTARLKIPRGAAVGIVLLLSALVIGVAVVLLFSELINEIWRLTRALPSGQIMRGYIDVILAEVEMLYLNVPHELESAIRDSIGSLTIKISNYLQSLLNYLLGIVKIFPQIFLFIIVTLVASFFMSKDREKISTFVFKQMPFGWAEKVRTVKEDLFAALIGFIKAQSILVTITFIQVLIGYNLMGLKYALFMAIITSILDILPIVGVGTILIPSAAIYLILGNVPMAIAFIILYISVLIVRQFLEPRIMGQNLGIHPLITLISIYVGLRAFGVIGILLGPLLVIVTRALQKAKILPQWRF